MLDGLNDEAKCWTCIVNVLLHDMLHCCRLSRVVQSAFLESAKRPTSQNPVFGTDSIKIRISLSFVRAFLRIESILAGLCSATMCGGNWWSVREGK